MQQRSQPTAASYLRPGAPRDQGGSGNLEGGPEPCPGGKSSLLPGRALGGWSPTSCCRPVRLLGQVHFFSSYFLFSRHYESSAKECERSEVFFPFRRGHARPAEVNRRQPRDCKGRDVWLEVNGNYKGSKADSERYQKTSCNRARLDWRIIILP